MGLSNRRTKERGIERADIMITLTEEQANEIVRRMDAAVRAGGLLAAEALLPVVIDWRQKAQQQEAPPCTDAEQQQS